MSELYLDPHNVDDYATFLKVKALPTYKIRGRIASFPDEYAKLLHVNGVAQPDVTYTPHPRAFDYQQAITALAVKKRKFAVFADCGLGKTLMLLEFARHAAESEYGKRILIVSPLMVMQQTIDEAARFYNGDLPIDCVPAAELQEWCNGLSGRIGITNWEAMREGLTQGNLAGLILDESSMLKSHYGKFGQRVIELGKGLPWKMCNTGTPAPNDRIEYANHAVFLDQFPNVNAFLARYFVNRGQTSNRWELKPHALGPFYRSLSHWSIFLNNPATYGWHDNTDPLPPIHVRQHHVDMTPEQVKLTSNMTGSLFAHKIGGIVNRASLSGIAKGSYHGKPVPTNKPAAVRGLVEQWPDESTIVWCLYNHEQQSIERALPDAASITGTTPQEKRQTIIDDFKAGRVKTLISKPKILGFGLNLQIATRQVFSGIQDSYESYYQAVKRSNRYGSERPLNVHIPITDIERPMLDTVLSKADRVQRDTEEQERIFKQCQMAL